MQSATVDYLHPGVHLYVPPPGIHRFVLVIMSGGGGGAQTAGGARQIAMANVHLPAGIVSMTVRVGDRGRGARACREVGRDGGDSSVELAPGQVVMARGGQGSSEPLLADAQVETDGQPGSVRIVPFT